MSNSNTVKQVQELYKSGQSVSNISKTLQKSSSNVSRWCRKTHEVFNDRDLTLQEKKRKRLFYLNRISVGNLDINKCRLLVSLLYWCEGAKYPSTGELAFTSSDEQMQIVFIKLLRKAYPKEIDEKKFRVMLQIPSVYNIEEIKAHWSKLLNISTKQFYKPYITKTQGNRYRKSYMGTCGLRYHDYRILLRVMGTYNQIAKQIIGDVVQWSKTTVR